MTPAPETPAALTNARSPHPVVDDDRSVVTILSGLLDKTDTLIRQEMKLAGAEIEQKMDKAKRELIALSLCGGLLFAGFSSLVAAVILLLSEAMEAWISAGLVGVAASLGGYLLFQREKRAAAQLVPERTIENVKKDVNTIREATP